MGAKAWQGYLPPDDGGWSELRPGEPGYDAATAADAVALADRPARDRDDLPACGMFFGAQVGFSPDREGKATSPGVHVPARTIEIVRRDADGEPCVVDVCAECGSGLMDVAIGGRTICSGCFKAGSDVVETAALLKAKSDADALARRAAEMKAAEMKVYEVASGQSAEKRRRKVASRLRDASRSLVVLA